jgi:hypothetical protein
MKVRLVCDVRGAAVLLGLLLALPACALAQEAKKATSKLEDPRLKLAQLTKEAIETQEKDLAQLQAEVLRAIEGMAPGKLDQEKLAVDGLKRLVSHLRGMAKELVEKHGKYAESAKALKDSMEKGAPAFREASKVFVKYAEEEPYKELKQDYLFLAEAWQDMAKVMEKRARELGAEPKEIAETMKYVERTAVFLERFETHLSSYPNLDTGAERQRYLEQMRKYVQGFEELRKLFRKFHGNLKSQALAPDLRQYPIALVDQSWGAFQGSLSDGFSLRQRLPFYRPGMGRVGTLEIMASRGEFLVVRAVSGTFPLPGDIITFPEKKYATALAMNSL